MNKTQLDRMDNARHFRGIYDADLEHAIASILVDVKEGKQRQQQNRERLHYDRNFAKIMEQRRLLIDEYTETDIFEQKGDK